MSYDNRLTAEQMTTLTPGDTVTIETYRGGWRGTEYVAGVVARLAPTQIVVTRIAPSGATYESRFRRKDAREVGVTPGALLVDPAHPATVRLMATAERAKREQAIDSLAHRWSRNRDDLAALRHLHTVIGEHLAKEAGS